MMFNARGLDKANRFIPLASLTCPNTTSSISPSLGKDATELYLLLFPGFGRPERVYNVKPSMKPTD